VIVARVVLSKFSISRTGNVGFFPKILKTLPFKVTGLDPAMLQIRLLGKCNTDLSNDMHNRT